MTVFNKMKGVGARVLGDDTAYYGLIIGLVAVASFGLGRLSVVSPSTSHEIMGPVNAAAAIEAKVPISEGMKASSTEPTLSPVSSETLYVGSKNSNKYHLPWCSGAKRIAETNKIFFKSKAEAEAAGYIPAANCKGI